MRLVVLVIFFVAVAVAAGAAPAELPNLPDLDVTYISQRPLYRGYWMDYPDDVPTFWVYDKNAPDGKRTVTKEEFQRLVKVNPAAGDKVTFTVHVRNNGFAPSEKSKYLLYIDDKVVAKGALNALQPDEEQAIPYEWIFREGRHTIACEVDPDDKIREICEINNRLTDPAYGLSMTIRTQDERNYKGFRSTTNMWGSYSFEDWCQAHIYEWRKAFREAIYPATPQGILQGIRIDGIFTSLQDPGISELRQAQIDSLRFENEPPSTKKPPTDNDPCCWRINCPEGHPDYHIPTYAKRIDRGLIHELCHQCGIIDIYQFGLSPSAILVTDPNGHFLWTGEGCYHQFNDLMTVYGVNTENPLEQHGLFREHTAAAFNSEIGKPRWGFGLYLSDVPKQNVLRILDNQGSPIPNADVKLYQMQIETRIVGEIPPKIGKTDANGEWDMGAHPIDKIHVVGTNGIIMIGIEAYGQWEFHTLVISEMNIAYWRGDRDRHVYAMRTGIAPPGTIPAPTNLKVASVNAKKLRLTWDYPNSERNLHKFLVMRRQGGIYCTYEPAFTDIAGEVWSHERSAEVEVEGQRNLFAVVAVDQMGNQSGYSNIAVFPSDELLPDVGRVLGVARTPDGSIYVLNTDGATILGLTPKGGRINLANNVRLPGPSLTYHMASDSHGILYVPCWTSGSICRVDPAKREVLAELKSKDIQQPRGISIDEQDNLYLTDVAAKDVKIIKQDGTLLGTIGGTNKFVYPLALYADKKGSVYVVDCLFDPATYPRSPAAVYVFRKTSNEGWSYERTVKIEETMAINCVIADEQGRIYAGGPGGITAYDKDGRKLAQWVGVPNGTNMGAGWVCAMAWEPDGNLLVLQGFTLLKLIRVTPGDILACPVK